MRQNLANRLAGGGFWALRTAWMCVEGVQHMREQDIPPAVNFTDRQVFITAAINAFNVFLNINMDGVILQTPVAVEPEEVEVKYADKYGKPITQDEWLQLLRGNFYKQVDLWRNGLESVYTVWTGVDTNGCTPPHIFATAVVRTIDGEPQVQKAFRSTCLADARRAHRGAIELVKQGKI